MKSDKALKAFYGAREGDVPRLQDIFTPLSLIRPLMSVWGGVVLDPCGHRDSPLYDVIPEVWLGEPAAWADDGTPTKWSGNGMRQPWVDCTYVNPPFSELKQWLAHAAKQDPDKRIAVLMPARLQRPWLRDYLQGRTVVALNSVKFEGYKGAFPQALLLVVQGPDQTAVGEAYETAGLGGVL